MRVTACIAVLALGVATQANAQMTAPGSVALELRHLPESPAFPGQSDDRLQFTTSLDVRLSYDWNGGADRFVISPFLRFGGNGDGRDHFDLREAYWLHQGDGWGLTVGADKVFLGVTESRHLADIIKQDDALEDIDGEDKLCQPMVSLSLYGDYGTFSVYGLPWFRTREFQGFGSRLGGLTNQPGGVRGCRRRKAYRLRVALVTFCRESRSRAILIQRHKP